MSNKPKIYAPIATGSTEPRDLRDRFADVVNVKDFGAKGDGITDDTEAFEAAAAFGTLVWVPGGKYSISYSVPGIYLSSAPVFTNHPIALTDIGDIRASQFFDRLTLGFVGSVKRCPEYPSNRTAFPVQGMACDGVDFLFIGQHYENSTQYITKYQISTRTVVSVTRYENLGHCNSIEYKDGKLYVATLTDNGIAVINAGTMAFSHFITPAVLFNSITWDASRNCWWGTAGSVLRQYSPEFSLLSEQVLAWGDGETAGQSCACHEGLLYIPRFRDDIGTQRVRGHVLYVYDPATDRVIHKWDLPWGAGEIEDIVFYENYMLFNCGAANSYYYPIYGAQFKKGERSTFGPLPGENVGTPYIKGQHGTLQANTIYVDANATSQGFGTEEAPFNSIVSAFEVIYLNNHPRNIVYLTGDCSEGGYIAQFIAQGLHEIELRGSGNIESNSISGILFQSCYKCLIDNITIKPLRDQINHNTPLAAQYSNLQMGSIAWDTSAQIAALDGLLYCTYGTIYIRGKQDFTNVSADNLKDSYLYRFTYGGALILTGSASDIIVPEHLANKRVFDAKALVVAMNTGFDNMIFKDGDIHAQHLRYGEGKPFADVANTISALTERVAALEAAIAGG